MSKSKMKDAGLNNVGGRIRKARTAALLSIKELAEKIEVSFAYLGMVERGERNPSDKMLACIADVTGVTTGWLKDGDTPQDPVSSDEELFDVSLFLSLLLHEVPGTTPKALSLPLGSSEDEVNRILSEPDVYEPIWHGGCSTLAQSLDIPKCLKKLSEIERFLEWEEIKKGDYKIRGELSIALSEVFHDTFKFCGQDTQRSMRYPKMWSISNEPSEPTREFTFRQASTGGRCRVTIYIPLIERYADRLNGIVYDALGAHSDDFANIALVFSDKDSFDKSTTVIAEHMKNNQTSKKVAVMLIDPDSSRIIAKKPV